LPARQLDEGIVGGHMYCRAWCATVFDFDTTFGTIPMIDSFHVVDGQIMSIRVYYDPRPIFEG
jgi:hypothetical protein